MNALSLFDGMACGMIVFQDAGIEVERYDAYEFDEKTASEKKGRPFGFAAMVASHNFPNIIQHGNVFGADFTQYYGVDFLIGGSPCTYWSIAQKNGRETEASGIGWELFQQYDRAIKDAKPKFLIYENNKSMSNQIKASISESFGFEPVLINSKLVSAQNRERFYWVGKRMSDGTYQQVFIEQPQDRGILLRDILESGVPFRNEKGYCLDANYYRGGNATSFNKQSGMRLQVAEPVNVTSDGKAQTIKAQYYKNSVANFCSYSGTYGASGVAEPVRIGTIESDLKNKKHDSKQYRVYSPDGKATTLCGQGGGVGAKTGLYAVPVSGESLSDEYFKGGYDGDLIGMIENPSVCRNGKQPSQQYRVYSCEGKAVCVDCDQRKHYIVPHDGKTYPVYEVKNGLITIKDKQYPIKLADGYYIIRKLTVRECMRLQTVPEWYDFSVISKSQAYKCLGNGWTCDVISHIVKCILASEQEVEV